jgi:hypothetical protein
MPRKKITGGVSSAFRQVQQRAGALLLSLRNEIRAKEADLRRLHDGVSSLERLAGRAGRAVATPPAAGGTRRPTGGGRVNWSAILEQLPKQFKAADVRGIRGVQHKRSSEIFAAITRWIEAGSVKRKARGAYERV